MPFKIRTKLITAFLIMLFASMGFAVIVACYNQTVIHKAAVQRELRIKELKDRVNGLEVELRVHKL